MDANKRKSNWARFAPLAILIVAAVTGYVFFRDYLSLDVLRDNRAALEAWRDANYVLAASIYVLAYVLVVALSLPGALPMTLSGGFLFGLVPGVTLTVLGATLGATVIFLVARTSLGAVLQERAGPWLSKMEAGFREGEISYLLLMRLMPVVPFFVANLAPAFLGVSTFTFFWTTLVGIIPGTAVYTSVGTGLGEVFDRGGEVGLDVFADPAVSGPIIALIILAALPVIVKTMRKRRAA